VSRFRVFLEKLEQRVSAVCRRIDQIYMDKVDGKISEDFWQRKTAEWQLEEQQVLMAMQRPGTSQPGCAANGKKDFRTRA
jgi:hypothetical protein